jgi:hypothetical protein
MKLKLILTTAIVGGALALPSVSSAAPPPPPAPQLDTATATGSVAGSTPFFNIHVDAHSGPSGENPGGSASFGSTIEMQGPGGQNFPVDFVVSGPVTCLNVTGNEAVIKINATFVIFGGGGFFAEPVEINLVDNGGSGSDLFSAQGTSAPADCSGGSVSGFPLDGRAVVFDAKPLPTTKDQCKGDGWKQFGFKNQGQCIAFVNHGP